MKDITDLLRYITGMDVRIGLPNEHTENTELMKNISNPMYSTGIGLIIESIARDEAVNKNKKKETKPETPVFSKPTFNLTPEQQPEDNTVVVVVDDDDTRTNNDENDDDTSRGKNLWGKMMDAAKKWFDNVAKEVDD